ncbi:cytochrome P450 [Streptomyces albicerus]|uniref:cytochrome P450 n=1 Tax=Streptomyces albicerus TaxID=2569859 RepID=UPI00124B00C7|nr:cytochrome P450 [Streptomyces albicerus]
MTIADTSREPTLRSLLTWMRHHRETGSVHYDERLRSWQVFGHAEVERVLSDPATFSSDFDGVFPGQPDFERYAQGNFLITDPPRHRKLRGLVTQAFTPRRVAGLAPRIAAATDHLLDGLGGAERFDIVEALAVPLPVIVIAELLGIPAQDRAMFRQWADALLNQNEGPVVRPDRAGVDTLGPVLREMNSYLLAHIGERRARLQDDLVSALVRAEDDGRQLDDDQVLGIVALLLLAGHFTTSALLTNAVVTLDEHPEATVSLRADRAALPVAIEEVLRYRPSFPRVTRRVTREVELGGRRMPRDALVVPWLASANRDPDRFREPDRFDFRRRPNRHLSFGHGIHFCLGAPLARLETEVVLNRLFDRYRAIDVVRDMSDDEALAWEAVSIRRLTVHATAATGL